MKTITWNEKTVKTTDVKPSEYNPRKINNKAQKHFEQNMEEYGTPEPIVVNADNTIIGGHMRHAIYLKKNIKEIKVFYPSRKLTEEEEKELNVLLNSATGYTDSEKLNDLGLDNKRIKELGFSEFKLPEIKLKDSAVVVQGTQKNKNRLALFFTEEEYTKAKRGILKVMQNEKLKDTSEAFVFLVNNAYE